MTLSDAPGEVALVLHTHLPWVAGHGVWPVGEEWLHQVWSHSWLPVTRVLERLGDEGHRQVLTLGVTPMVAAQLADTRLAQDTGTWLGGQMWRAEEQRWHWWLQEPIQQLAHHHWKHHQELLAYHEDVESRGGLLAVWAALAEQDVIELLGGPSTHAYLPLIDEPAAVHAQLATGLDAHAAWADARPSGIWPPELAYRPSGTVLSPEDPEHTRNSTPRPGLEAAYAAAGITHILVDAATARAGATHADLTFQDVRDGVVIAASEVVAFVRDDVTATRVWDAEVGYPTDPWYRDFHTQGTFGAHRSHRVTGLDVSWQDKAPYDPAAALRAVDAHAIDTHALLSEQLRTRPGGVVSPAFDTELLGHWWYEGPAWLDRLLRRIADDPQLRTTTLASRLARHRPTVRLALPESSWGVGNDHRSWANAATAPMWQRIVDVESRAGAAVAAAAASGRALQHPDVVAQLARELAQLRCSDWPYMVGRDQSPAYARDRVRHHGDAADELCWMLEQGTVDLDRVAVFEAATPEPRDTRHLVSALAKALVDG